MASQLCKRENTSGFLVYSVLDVCVPVQVVPVKKKTVVKILQGSESYKVYLHICNTVSDHFLCHLIINQIICKILQSDFVKINI